MMQKSFVIIQVLLISSPHQFIVLTHYKITVGLIVSSQIMPGIIMPHTLAALAAAHKASEVSEYMMKNKNELSILSHTYRQIV